MSTAANAAAAGRAPLWARTAATFFGIGKLRPGPGTWASVATVALWAIAAPRIPAAWQGTVAAAIALAAVLVGIPAATRVCRAERNDDPQTVVVDEVAGQMITLIAAPLHWKSLLAGLILFRAFDILKPPPARQLERLHAGLGVVLDDVAAGLYALIVMQTLIYFAIVR